MLLVGTGMLDRAATLSSLGRTPSTEMRWPKKSTRAAPICLAIAFVYGDSFRVWTCSRANKVASVATLVRGQLSDKMMP